MVRGILVSVVKLMNAARTLDYMTIFVSPEFQKHLFMNTAVPGIRGSVLGSG